MLNEFIIKVASRCNLNCAYCYEYNTGYDLWQAQPVRMEIGTMTVIAQRISEYAIRHELQRVYISFHGGEPLLAGKHQFSEYLKAFHASQTSGCEYVYSIQTNATLLDEEWIELFDKFHVLVGVSLDGDKAQNDKHRLDKRGMGSHESVIKSIEKLKISSPKIFNGILAVVDPEFDPKVALDHLSKLHGNLDFLLPHYNHDTFPRAYYGKALFAKFYLALFDAWLELNDPGIHIRYLESIIRRFYGGNSLYEVMNDEPPSLLTISTNGDIEGVDTLKSNGLDTNKTNLNIHTCALDDPNLAKIYESIAQPPLSQICLDCELFAICKGGYVPHRYSATNGYANPSVYCEDIKILIPGLKERIRRFTEC